MSHARAWAGTERERGHTVQIDKEMVLGLLREQGKEQEAEQARRELPDEVDTERDAGSLQRFGIDPADLLSRFTGGRDIPGL
jgi:hypothetical protein